jgi:HSP20 family molecular chaperone IbpA
MTWSSAEQPLVVIHPHQIRWARFATEVHLHASARRRPAATRPRRRGGVPDGVDTDKIEANFKNGVLTVTLPKTVQAQKSKKKIAIKKA